MGLLPYEKIKVCVQPPDIHVDSDGTFRGAILVKLNKDKTKLINPPSLLINSDRNDYSESVIHLEHEGFQGNITNYDVEVISEDNLIMIHKPVEFFSSSSSKQEYKKYDFKQADFSQQNR
jgi:hypothetical protein